MGRRLSKEVAYDARVDEQNCLMMAVESDDVSRCLLVLCFTMNHHLVCNSPVHERLGSLQRYMVLLSVSTGKLQPVSGGDEVDCLSTTHGWETPQHRKLPARPRQTDIQQIKHP